MVARPFYAYSVNQSGSGAHIIYVAKIHVGLRAKEQIQPGFLRWFDDCVV
jgi:hypothetical protein